MEADRDQRHRHPDLRGAAAAGPDHGQARRRPLAGRQPGRPRRHPGLQRPPPAASRRPAGGWPQFGSAVAKLQGPVDPAVPPFVSLCYTCTHGPYNEPGPGFLGPSLAPFRAMGQTRDDMVLRGITVDRLADRKTLLQELRRPAPRRRRHRRDAGRWTPSPSRRSGCSRRRSMADALDLSRETAQVVERYGTGDPKVFMDGNGAPRVPQSLLMARRLVEAGARVVTLNYSKWDWHGGKNAEGRADNSIFLREAEDFPVFDQCVSALVEDLHQRGLDKDCTVVIMGEFGRTPKISAQVGRDHWPQVNCALLAGGGMRTGQVIGATDRIAGEAAPRPVTLGELFATLYHNLGIDAAGRRCRTSPAGRSTWSRTTPSPLRGTGLSFAASAITSSAPCRGTRTTPWWPDRRAGRGPR